VSSEVTNPYVSYTIITYNRQDDLREAVDCILGQDYAPFEIVVVDNHSADDSQKLF
jgi:glycosyltransferase involved in cell wall biosynthesis